MNVDVYFKAVICCILMRPNQLHVIIVKTAEDRKRLQAQFLKWVYEVPGWLRPKITYDTQRNIEFENGCGMLFVLTERELKGRTLTSVACLNTVDQTSIRNYISPMTTSGIFTVSEEYA